GRWNHWWSETGCRSRCWWQSTSRREEQRRIDRRQHLRWCLDSPGAERKVGPRKGQKGMRGSSTRGRFAFQKSSLQFLLENAADTYCVQARAGSTLMRSGRAVTLPGQVTPFATVDRVGQQH